MLNRLVEIDIHWKWAISQTPSCQKPSRQLLQSQLDLAIGYSQIGNISRSQGITVQDLANGWVENGCVPESEKLPMSLYSNIH